MGLYNPITTIISKDIIVKPRKDRDLWAFNSSFKDEMPFINPINTQSMIKKIIKKYHYILSRYCLILMMDVVILKD